MAWLLWCTCTSHPVQLRQRQPLHSPFMWQHLQDLNAHAAVLAGLTKSASPADGTVQPAAGAPRAARLILSPRGSSEDSASQQPHHHQTAWQQGLCASTQGAAPKLPAAWPPSASGTGNFGSAGLKCQAPALQPMLVVVGPTWHSRAAAVAGWDFAERTRTGQRLAAHAASNKIWRLPAARGHDTCSKQ